MARLVFAATVAVAAVLAVPATAAAPSVYIKAHWVDRKQTQYGNVIFETQRIKVSGDKWTIAARISNKTKLPLYAYPWSITEKSLSGSPITNFYGPGLTYPGKDVLGHHQMIHTHARWGSPKVPFPLKPGKTWTGRFGGADKLPRGTIIYVLFGRFSVRSPYDPLKGPSDPNSRGFVQWISSRGFQIP